MLILHDPRCAEYGDPSRPERGDRVQRAAGHLRAAHPGWKWMAPLTTVSDEALLLAHTAAHIDRLAEARDFDSDTPFFPGIETHARRSVAAAIEAVSHSLDRHAPVFSLMRPPGHHATANTAMGFCYLNQVAVAALVARRDFGAVRIAVWDFDAHHGNGTEAILMNRPGFLYCSVHEFPAYPGTGTCDIGNSRNWPVLPLTPRPQHMAALRASWDAVVGFRPDLVLVSAGFDAYCRDPITSMTLEKEDFAELGAWLHSSGLAVAAILEGGYSEELPLLIDAFLAAWTHE
jgi:acetoin utilization deacetylase AcuC-like enzyme